MQKINNFIKCAYARNSRLLNVSRNCATHEKLEQKKYPTPEEETRREIDAAMDIESSLFENSSKLFKPAKFNEVSKYEKITRKPIKQANFVAPKPNKVVYKNYKPELIEDAELGLTFSRLKLNDPIFNKLLTDARSRKRRQKNQQIIIEGRRLIVEALNSGLKPISIIFSQKDKIMKISENIRPHNGSVKIYQAPQHDLKTWSTLSTPPGVLAIFNRPSEENLTLPPEEEILPISVICDNIREPNNLGSIVRTAAAVPCEQVIMLKGCCDPWESKALRGGSGAQFHIRIRDGITWSEVGEYIPPNFSTFAAENNCEKIENSSFFKVKKGLIRNYTDLGADHQHYVVVIGGETHGISEEAYRFIDCTGGVFLNISLANTIESLNASCALSLILFEIRQQIWEQPSVD